LTLVAILTNTICLRVCPWSCAVANVKYALSLGVVHQTVSDWVAAYADALPDRPPQPGDSVETAELDELYTFVGHKKRCLCRDEGGPRYALYHQLCGGVGTDVGRDARGDRGRGPSDAVLF